MHWTIIAALAAGLAAGLAFSFLLRIYRAKTAKELAEELLRQKEAERKRDMEAVIEHVKASFGSLSLEALSKSTEELLKLAKTQLESERQASVRELEARKELIDRELRKMAEQVDSVGRLMRELEKDRVEKFGELAKHLQMAGEQTALLAGTTASLKEALAGTKSRGQWGERMAEDILRVSGFVENVNYLKQKTIQGAGGRPDFTFLLPRGLRLNMDVKFPFDNYVRFLDAAAEGEKARFRAEFLRDVKAKVKEVATRDYIDPGQSTLDCALLLIANEQVYAFIQEQDSSVLDEALRQRVVCCSPVTLFAVLAVIRQAVDAFSMEETSNEVLSLLGGFKKQWDEFLKRFAGMGRRIGELQRDFDELSGVRRRQLERPLNRIEEIRNERGLASAPGAGGGGEGEEEGPPVS
jgi:DNA recombination protein RmuC